MGEEAQAPTGYTYTRKGMAAAILLGIIQSYTIAMTLRVGMSRGGGVTVLCGFCIRDRIVGGCSVRVF